MTVRTRATPSHRPRSWFLRPLRQLAPTLLYLGLSIGMCSAPALATAPAEVVGVEAAQEQGAQGNTSTQETVVNTGAGEGGFPWGLLGLLGLFGLARRRGAKVVYLPAETSPVLAANLPPQDTEQVPEELDDGLGAEAELETEEIEIVEAERGKPEAPRMANNIDVAREATVVTTPPPPHLAKTPYISKTGEPEADNTEDDDYLETIAAPPFMQQARLQPLAEYGGDVDGLEQWEGLETDLQPLERDELENYPAPPRRR